jgi:hypothetical protein
MRMIRQEIAELSQKMSLFYVPFYANIDLSWFS